MSIGLEYVEAVSGSRGGDIEVPGGAGLGVAVHVAEEDDVGFQALEAVRGGVSEDGRVGGEAEVVDGFEAEAGESRASRRKECSRRWVPMRMMRSGMMP